MDIVFTYSGLSMIKACFFLALLGSIQLSLEQIEPLHITPKHIIRKWLEVVESDRDLGLEDSDLLQSLPWWLQISDQDINFADFWPIIISSI